MSLDSLKQIAGIMEGVVADVEKSVKTTLDSKLSQFQSEVDKRMKELDEKKDVRRVQINELDPKKISGTIAPEFETTLKVLKAGMNAMLVGPAGCGKTTIAKQVSESLDLEFGSVCLTAGASETWLFGRQTPTGFVEGMFSKLYKNGGVFLADEMDAADANLLLAINTALANGLLYNPINGEQYPRHKDFYFIGACNTFGKGADHVYTGRNQLDGATLDRFIIVQVDYNEKLETKMLKDQEMRAFLKTMRKEITKKGYNEIISTRAFDYASRLLEIGFEKQIIAQMLTESWNKDLKEIVKKYDFGTKTPGKPEEDTKKLATKIDSVWRGF
jgi:MoxR-like ATPase